MLYERDCSREGGIAATFQVSIRTLIALFLQLDLPGTRNRSQSSGLPPVMAYPAVINLLHLAPMRATGMLWHSGISDALGVQIDLAGMNSPSPLTVVPVIRMYLAANR